MLVRFLHARVYWLKLPIEVAWRRDTQKIYLGIELYTTNSHTEWRPISAFEKPLSWNIYLFIWTCEQNFLYLIFLERDWSLGQLIKQTKLLLLTILANGSVELPQWQMALKSTKKSGTGKVLGKTENDWWHPSFAGAIWRSLQGDKGRECNV